MFEFLFCGNLLHVDFSLAESDWSNIQTVTISNESISSSPTVPEFLYLLVIPLLLSALAVALGFRIMKLGYFSHHKEQF